jgi:hypothetical protein
VISAAYQGTKVGAGLPEGGAFVFIIFVLVFLAFQGSRSSQKHKFQTCIIN